MALKVLGSTGEPQAKNSLKRELAALLAVKHERIPKLYDWNISDEAAFVALEYFPSGSMGLTP